MKLVRFKILKAAGVIPVLLLTACFTGIESTPKITADQLKKEKIQSGSPEETMSVTIAPERPSTWMPGRQYLVSDPRIKLVFSGTSEDKLPQPGDTLIYTGNEGLPSLMGTTNVAFKFLNKKNQADTLTYISDVSPEDLAERRRLDIPFMIDLQLVATADSQLVGKELFIMTPYRYDMNNRPVNGRKFIKVTVNRAVAGNADYPIRLLLTDCDSKQFSVLMTTGNDRSSTRNFATLFSIKDPRERYPMISDENWEAITYSRVLPYMTRDEARMAVGSPTEIDRGRNYSSSYERWIYPNGAYLVFEDGLLKSFRI